MTGQLGALETTSPLLDGLDHDLDCGEHGSLAALLLVVVRVDRRVRETQTEQGFHHGKRGSRHDAWHPGEVCQ